MSFAQLHAAASTAAADAAYLEDVGTVQQLLQQLRRHALAVRALQRCHRKLEHPQQQPQASLEKQQQMQRQHQQQMQRELEAARRAADSVRRALRQLQQHVVAASSMNEKHERQVYYTQLVSAAGLLLRQLRDAAEGEECLLRQQHELLLLETSEQCAPEQRLALQRQQQGEQAGRHHEYPALRASSALTSDATSATRGDAAAGAISAGEAAGPGESGWRATGDGREGNSTSKVAPAASAPIEVAPAGHEAPWAWPQSGVCPGPLQVQHQLMQANMSVPIFIPDSKIDASLLQEKRESLAKIRREISSIQSLYEQMALFTEEQGERLDVVDQGLISAQQEAARATREIAAAAREERRRKCRRCLFGSSMLLLLVLFGFALWWNATS